MRGLLMAVVAVLSLSACGGDSDPVDFGGTFSGMLTATGPCSDGTTANFSSSVTMVAAHDGNSFSASGDSLCAAISAHVTGAVATLDPKACAPITKASRTDTPAVTGGSITVNGASLAVSVEEENSISNNNGGNWTCTLTISGALTKR